MNNYAQYLFNLENPTDQLRHFNKYQEPWFNSYFAAKEIGTPKNIYDEMQDARSVLTKVHALDPHAIIVGGAPRSWFFGQNANDVDIHFYLGDSRNMSGNDVKYMLECATGLDVSRPLGCYDQEDTNSEATQHPYMDAVYNAESNGIKYQFIRLRCSTFGVIDKFTMNMAQAWSMGTDVETNTCFNVGVVEKSLIKVDHEYPSKSSFVDKYKEYFKDWTYFDSPNHFNVHKILTEGKDLSYNPLKPWEDASVANLKVLMSTLPRGTRVNVSVGL